MQCQNLRQGPDWISKWPPYGLHYFVSHFGRVIKTFYLGTVLLYGIVNHMAGISEFKMAATLIDMLYMIDRCGILCQLSLRKLLYLHFVQMAAIFNFTMDHVWDVYMKDSLKLKTRATRVTGTRK